MKIVKILMPLLIAVMCSCKISEEQRQKICDNCPVKITKKDSIVYVHDTVIVKIPGKAGPRINEKNPCDSLGQLKKDLNITVTKNGQTVNVRSLNGNLDVTSETKDTSAKAPILKKETYSKTENESVKWMPCTNERTAADGFYKIGFFILLAIVVLYYLKRRFWK